MLRKHSVGLRNISHPFDITDERLLLTALNVFKKGKFAQRLNLYYHEIPRLSCMRIIRIVG